jgi:imidazolonepropionase-like amidohydrolase
MRRILVAALLAASAVSGAAQPAATTTTIKARTVIDGRGGSTSNATVTIRDGKIVSVGPASGTATIDLGNLTLLPGFIDTHVHIGWHFDDKGRYHSGPEPAEQAALYGAENAYVTLISDRSRTRSGQPSRFASRFAS